MVHEWRIIHEATSSALRQLWIRLESGFWVPTDRYRYDGRSVPAIAGGAPDVIDKQVGASADDAIELNTGAVYASMTSLQLTNNLFWAGFRFTGVSGLAGATVITAKWDGYWNDDTDDFPDEDIYAEAGVSPVAFQEVQYNISGRARTTAYVNWTSGGVAQGIGWASEKANPPPEIKTVIQELVDNFDPSSIVIIFDHTTNYDSEWTSWDGNPALAAKLYIEFTPATGAYYHGLKVQGEAAELALCDVGSNPLRFRKGGATYGIELVAVDDPNASRVRIKTPTGIKAARKYT